MTENDSRKKLGLVGHPITHSLSPKLFSEYFASRPDILSRYSYNLIISEDFDEAMRIFMDGYLAVNVTTPFKTLAYNFARQRDASADLCGAANLLVKEDAESECVTAYNTDYMAALEIFGRLLQHRRTDLPRVIVVGFGGAGRAAAAAALQQGLQVRVCNRTVSKVKAFMPKVAVCATDRLAECVRDSDIIVNALPAEAAGVFRALLEREPEGLLHGTVIELSYAHPILKGARVGEYVSGLEWLRLQAEATYRIVLKERF